MTEPNALTAELRVLLERATARQEPGQSSADWNDDRLRARFEIVDRLPGVLDRIAELEEALSPFVSDDAIYLSGVETEDEEHPIWVTTKQIVAARTALSQPPASEVE